MDKKAWVHQLKRHVDTKGADKASWYVTWNDPNGKRRTKSCGPGKIGKSAATKEADRIHSELVTGVYQSKMKSTWAEFMACYRSHVESRFEVRSRETAIVSLETFARIVRPKYLRSVMTDTIDQFIGERLKEKATIKKRETDRTISPATVNRELRYVRAAMRLAADWGFITKVPRFRFLKPPEKLPTFIPPEHFTAIFQACDVAEMPSDIPNVTAPEFWRALLILLNMTGWRIKQTLAVQRSDVNLKEMKIVTRADDNKGRRDQEIPLHPVVVQYLEPLMHSFSELLFPWNNHIRTLWTEFHRIQNAARLEGDKPLPKGGKDGGWYGFHDLRRGFATVNASSMNLFELQTLMQHKSLITTRGYVNMGSKLNKVVSNLQVPTLRSAESG